MIWDPVVVRVEGAEHFKETFPNECVLLDVKGPIFDFSDGVEYRGAADMTEGRGMQEVGHPSFHGGLHGHHGHHDDFKTSKAPSVPEDNNDAGYYYEDNGNKFNW
ncbi:hypothetical protein BJF83_04315 [Nocardiopsis sp. CNR-923]|nr:hypothetical protein BJF83_04315 [Nocardiopsis sp. CNR-923]